MDFKNAYMLVTIQTFRQFVQLCQRLSEWRNVAFSPLIITFSFFVLWKSITHLSIQHVPMLMCYSKLPYQEINTAKGLRRSAESKRDWLWFKDFHRHVMGGLCISQLSIKPQIAKFSHSLAYSLICNIRPLAYLYRQCNNRVVFQVTLNKATLDKALHV